MMMAPLGGGKEGDARGDRAEHVAASQRCPRIVRFRTLRSVAPDDGGGSRGADAGARGGGATREERVGGGDDGHSDSTSWPVKLWPYAASNADVICLGFQLNKRGKVKPLFYCYCLLIHFEINEAHDESPTARSLDLRYCGPDRESPLRGSGASIGDVHSCVGAYLSRRTSHQLADTSPNVRARETTRDTEDDLPANPRRPKFQRHRHFVKSHDEGSRVSRRPPPRRVSPTR